MQARLPVETAESIRECSGRRSVDGVTSCGAIDRDEGGAAARFEADGLVHARILSHPQRPAEIPTSPSWQPEGVNLTGDVVHHDGDLGVSVASHTEAIVDTVGRLPGHHGVACAG